MVANSDWTNSVQQMQKSFQHGLAGMLEGLQKSPIADASSKAALQFSEEKLSQVQKQYLQEISELWSSSLKGNPTVKDKRFSYDAWSKNTISDFAAAQ